MTDERIKQLWLLGVFFRETICLALVIMRLTSKALPILTSYTYNDMSSNEHNIVRLNANK